MYVKSIGSRSGNDDLRVHQFLVEFRVLPFLVRRGDQGVPLLFKPFAETKLILRRTEQFWYFACVFVAL